MTLAIINREPHGGPIPPGVAVWRTCLREVLFADEAGLLSDAGGRPMLDEEAYRLLLEILCGLQSPMIGETQVVAQFKSFLGQLSREHAWIGRVGQRLLADARQVRVAHLGNLGARSYGVAVSDCVGGAATVALIGTGKLAADIIPFLVDRGRHVQQWGRAPAVPTRPGVCYRPLEALDAFPVTEASAALVVAAPAPASAIARVAAAYHDLVRVIDLRAEAETDPVRLPIATMTLRDLFASMDGADRGVLEKVDAARAEIVERSRRYGSREEIRPFGWEDVCA